VQIEYFFVDSKTPDHYRNGFIEVYKEAFSLHPYHEDYTNSEVPNEVWMSHLNDGIILLACDGKSVVGLGCATPLLKSPPEIQEYLRGKQTSKDLPIEFSDAWYISELGVRLVYQKRRIGTQIIKGLLAHILEHQCHYFVTRTAAEASNSIRIFKKVGGIELPEPQDVSSSDQVQVNKSQSTARVYLYGRCEQKVQKSI